MTPKKKDSTKDAARPRLTRERVVSNALTLVDREGLDALTMRALGQECNCDPMGIYRHVQDKDELLDAMADAMWNEIELPPDGLPGTWQEQFREAFRILKDTLGSRPNALPVVFRRAGLTGSALARTEFALEILISAGLPPVDAMWGLDTASCYILGCVMGEAAAAASGISPDQAMEMYARLSPVEYPNLAKVMMSGPKMEAGDSFDHGMNIIIGGLERLLEQARAAETEEVDG